MWALPACVDSEWIALTILWRKIALPKAESAATAGAHPKRVIAVDARNALVALA